MSVVSASASRTSVVDRVLDFVRGAIGARLEALLEKRCEFVGIARLDVRRPH